MATNPTATLKELMPATQDEAFLPSAVSCLLPWQQFFVDPTRAQRCAAKHCRLSRSIHRSRPVILLFADTATQNGHRRGTAAATNRVATMGLTFIILISRRRRS